MVGKTIWQQVVFEMRTVETLVVEMEVPVQEGDSPEDILELGLEMAQENSGSIWTNPQFKINTDLSFSRPRIVQWFPNNNGRPDYQHPLSYDPNQDKIVQQQGD